MRLPFPQANLPNREGSAPLFSAAGLAGRNEVQITGFHTLENYPIRQFDNVVLHRHQGKILN